MSGVLEKGITGFWLWLPDVNWILTLSLDGDTSMLFEAFSLLWIVTSGWKHFERTEKTSSTETENPKGVFDGLLTDLQTLKRLWLWSKNTHAHTHTHTQGGLCSVIVFLLVAKGEALKVFQI